MAAFKKRSVDIKLNKKEKLTLGRRVTMKLGVSKKKVSPQDKVRYYVNVFVIEPSKPLILKTIIDYKL